VLNKLEVSLPLNPLLATQLRDETIQLHTSALAIGGRALAAAQELPVVGQAWATVLVTV